MFARIYGSDESLAQPGAWLVTGWRHRHLIARLAKRELLAKYRGSVLGVAWTVLVPLLMLSVYTFVFSHLLNGRWGEAEGTGPFALRLFCGLIIFQVFAGALYHGPFIIHRNVGYVKNVVFPLEVLAYVTLLPILVEAGISLVLLLVFQLGVEGTPPLTVLLVPLLIIPLSLGSLGVMWFLSALGVYLRDIQQIVGVLTTALMFLSAIFYPISIIPDRYQILIKANPLAMIIVQARAMVFSPEQIDWLWIAGLSAGTLFFAELCFRWFQKTRDGFADVL